MTRLLDLCVLPSSIFVTMETSTHWGVNEVEHVHCAVMLVEHCGCLCLHGDPTLPLHWEAIKHLLVATALLYHTCTRDSLDELTEIYCRLLRSTADY